jgi:homoserine kinase
VALSGAGPAVLMIVEREADRNRLHALIHRHVEAVDTVEILECEFEKACGIMA